MGTEQSATIVPVIGLQEPEQVRSSESNSGGRPRKVLVTGDRGFVGEETKKVLPEDQVVGYDLMDGRDIRDREQLEYIVREYGVTHILHLAAIARFADADRDPVLAFETNVLGTANVVNVAKKYHLPLVYASTGSAIMPLNDYEPPFTEDIPARGNSVYGCTKALGERYVQTHTPHIVLRYAHLYGAEKRFHGLIGGFLSRIERGLAPELYGGQQTNSFVYIKDVAVANAVALNAAWDKWNQVYNIGSDEELSAESAGQTICDIFGYEGKITKKPGRTVDASRFKFDLTKTKRMLGWAPLFDFKAGLQHMKEEMQ